MRVGRRAVVSRGHRRGVLADLPAAIAGKRAGAAAHRDAMSSLIAQVESELRAAFASLDGWAEDVLDREHERLAELTAALGAQAARVRQMDELLETCREPADDDLGEEPIETNHPRFARSAANRSKNLARLAEVRRQTRADLLATLAWLRELVSMIHLAKFTGAPASRAAELVAQIAAAVEGISDVTWREEGPLTPSLRSDERDVAASHPAA